MDDEATAADTKPQVYREHSLRLSDIDADALKVVSRLQRHGYQAFFVGGCVRDILLGEKPKDFDVATSATPRQVYDLFRNCRVIGRRFRLCHVFFGDKIIEVATFRSASVAGTQEPKTEKSGRRNQPTGAGGDGKTEGRGRRAAGADSDSRHRRRGGKWRKLIDEPLPQGFGTACSDANLRDFTVNALFLEVSENVVIDYVGGWHDLHNRILRTIGEASERMADDPVRIIRAARYAARHRFDIAKPTWLAMQEHADRLSLCASRRVLDELIKVLHTNAAAPAFRMLARMGVPEALLPELRESLPAAPSPTYGYLETIDALPPNERTEALLIAVLFFETVCKKWKRKGLGRPGEQPQTDCLLHEGDAAEIASELIRDFQQRHSLARRDAACAAQIIIAQRRMQHPHTRRRAAARFRDREWLSEALALLQITNTDTELHGWWEEVASRQSLTATNAVSATPRRRKRFRPKKKRASTPHTHGPGDKGPHQ